VRRAIFTVLFCFLLLGSLASAHVGSPDVYYEGASGPYRLFVTVRTPQMIPGIARIEVQVLDGPVSDIQIVPLRVIGEGSQTAPPADSMEQSKSDRKFFTGKLWLMESGSFQVRIEINGERGKAQMGVPVPAFAQRTLGMQKTTGLVLTALMIFLVLSLISILGAATRESQLEPGSEVPPASRHRGRIAMAVTALVIWRFFSWAISGGVRWQTPMPKTWCTSLHQWRLPSPTAII